MHEEKRDDLTALAKAIRYWILTATHRAGSGHPTSALSAVELMTTLFFGGHLRYRAEDPDHPNNDRVIFSKGHASPLLYALWVAAGRLNEEQMLRYRRFDSRLEGHPTSRFEYTEAATGSLGQGLSIGMGMALNAKHIDSLPCRSYVLLGDSEMAEGSQWEAIQLAAHYQLDNLVGVLDVNRLGQRGPTMYQHDLHAYRQRLEAFGWNTHVVEDGHDLDAVDLAFEQIRYDSGKPTMIIAQTTKGKGVSFLEDEEGWHGKALDSEQLESALEELAPVDRDVRGEIELPIDRRPEPRPPQAVEPLRYAIGEELATRDAYGNALARLAPRYPDLIALDGEVCNSTRSEKFGKAYPNRFFEMYIAEQNMVGAALGLSLRGRLPFISTFAAFLTRAYDQIRMSCHSRPNLKLVGSHAGVSIGQDGPSQMGLEDLAMFRTLPESVVLYPCDAVATEHLVANMAEHDGLAYLRTTRGKTQVIYENRETFPIGGSKTLRCSDHDEVTVIAAGITVFEALRAHDRLKAKDITLRVIDLYCVKPLDEDTLREAAEDTHALITVEDHYAEGGIGEAVSSLLSRHTTPVYRLAVRHRPRSGKPDQLLEDAGISADAIVEIVHRAMQRNATLAESTQT